MKLYQSPGSPNARRVRFYVAERGLPIEQVLVDLSKKEQFADITAFVTIDFATAAAGKPLPESNGATRRWYDSVAARPASKA